MGGLGSIHGVNIAAHPRAELANVYDIYPAAAEMLAAYSGAKVASGPAEIWASDVDAVLITSSTNTHADLLSAAIKANKAVYCEKPINCTIFLGRTPL